MEEDSGITEETDGSAELQEFTGNDNDSEQNDLADSMLNLCNPLNQNAPQASGATSYIQQAPTVSDLKQLRFYEDKAPKSMVINDDTYYEWLDMEKNLFMSRYFRDVSSMPSQKYKILRKLGRGGFGLVLLVQIEGTHSKLAMKIMSKDQIKEKKMVKYIVGERRALSAVNHPLIMGMIDRLKDNSNVYIIIPFIECGNLFDLKRQTKNGRFSYEVSKFFAAQVFLAFEYLHRMRIVYRDLKPENLMMERSGYIQLVDLGFAKLLDRDQQRTYSTLGTPDYMAPEIFALKHCGYGYSVDWWTLGCLLYELMFSKPPFYIAGADPLRTVRYMLTNEIKFPAGVKPDAKDIMQSLCQKQPTQRLGCQRNHSTDIRKHAYFKDIDFVALYNRNVRLPYHARSKGYYGDPVPSDAVRVSKTMRHESLFEQF